MDSDKARQRDGRTDGRKDDVLFSVRRSGERRLDELVVSWRAVSRKMTYCFVAMTTSLVSPVLLLLLQVEDALDLLHHELITPLQCTTNFNVNPYPCSIRFIWF